MDVKQHVFMSGYSLDENIYTDGQNFDEYDYDY